MELGRTVRAHGGNTWEIGDADLIWEGHKAGRDIGYCHLVKLDNLEAFPSKGLMLSRKDPWRIGRLDESSRNTGLTSADEHPSSC